MRKLIYMVLIALTGCSNEPAKELTSGVFIEENVATFIKDHPNWTENEATEKETTEKFKHKLINLSNDSSFLKNMPLQLREVKDTVINEIRTKIATFKAYGDTSRNKNSLLNYIQLQITGIVSDNQIKALALNKKYTLSGTLHKQGKRGDIKFIHVSEFKGYDLGKYTFLITGFKPI